MKGMILQWWRMQSPAARIFLPSVYGAIAAFLVAVVIHGETGFLGLASLISPFVVIAFVLRGGWAILFLPWGRGSDDHRHDDERNASRAFRVGSFGLVSYLLLVVGCALDLAGGLLHWEEPIDIGLPLAAMGIILCGVWLVVELTRKALNAFFVSW